MKPRSLVPIAAFALIALAGLAAERDPDSGSPTGLAGDPAPIVFVCQNGIAMSVWSALIFDRLAVERGLFDRLWVGDYRPQVVSAEDIGSAQPSGSPRLRAPSHPASAPLHGRALANSLQTGSAR
jgi:hypothetical protein